MQDRKDEKDAKAFREDVDYFLSKEEFNMFDFHERVLVSLKLFSKISFFSEYVVMIMFCVFSMDLKASQH